MTLRGIIGVLRWLVGVAAAAAVVMLFTLRGGTSQSDTPDAHLIADGAEVYAQHCQICHGSDGLGGTGPALSGSVAERFPDPSEQKAVILVGRSAMPEFGTRLDDHQIEAVIEFTRYGF